MNKKGLEMETIILLVIAIIVLVSFLGYIVIFTDLAKGTANKQTVQTWVRLKGIETGIKGAASASSRPPAPYIDEPLEVETQDLLFSKGDYPKIHKEIADSMYDCWEA